MSLQSCIDGCSNVLEFPIENEGIKFHELPKDDVIKRETCPSVLGKDTPMAQEEWVACSSHFTAATLGRRQEESMAEPKDDPIHFQHPSASVEPPSGQICRICLATDVKLLSIRKYKLDTAYEQLTGLCLNKDNLPKDLCVECAQRLYNSARFREKSCRAYLTLTEIAENCNGAFTLPMDIYLKRNRTIKNLHSSLKEKKFKPNYYDVIIDAEAKLKLKTEKDTNDDLPKSVKKEKQNKPDAEIDFSEMKPEFNRVGDDDDDLIDYGTDNTVLIVEADDKKSKRKVVKEKKKPVPRKTRSCNVPKPRKGRGSSTKQSPDLNNFTVTELTHEEQIANVVGRQKTDGYINAAYKCSLCYRGFSLKETFDKHMLRHSDVCGKSECPFCHLRFDNSHAMKKHTTGMHKQRFNCNECAYVTVIRTQAVLHGRKHKGVSYKCPHCDAVYKTLTAQLGHIRIKHPSDCVCELCGYSFMSKKGVFFHKKLAHRLDDKKVSKDGPLCAPCKIRFVSDDALTTHLSVSPKHAMDNPSSVDKTGVPKRNSRVIREGDKRSTSSLPKTCEHCGETLENSWGYYKHLRQMHNYGKAYERKNKKKLMCESCGKTFQNVTALKDHAWVHTGKKSYKCDICGKLFVTKAQLNFHVKTHLGNGRTFQCKLCEKHFSRPYNRDKHMKVVHSDLRPFKCEMCEKCFKTEYEKRAHVDHVHLKNPWPKRTGEKRNKDRSKAIQNLYWGIQPISSSDSERD